MAERTQWIALGGQVFQRNPAGIAGAAQQVQHARDGNQALVQRGPEILPGRRGRRRWGRLMESQRLLHPVFREFYGERELALEDRQRADSNPPARMLAELMSAAFKVHPYRNPPGGWPSDIMNLRRTQAQAFRERYYVPGNITVAIVGDVPVADAKRLAERYFGPMAAKPLPPLTASGEPPQNGPKTMEIGRASCR